METAGRSVQLEFPQYAAVLLEALNRQRLAGQFCDVAVHVGGRIFPAHKSVLAASSPYFHDKLLLRDASCLVLPGVIEAEAFGNLLQLIYSGRLTLLLEALPSHLLVASGLQMWQVVDRCSEILKELEGGPRRWAARGETAVATAAAAAEEVLQIHVAPAEEDEEDEEEEEERPPPRADVEEGGGGVVEPPKIYVKQEVGDAGGFLRAEEPAAAAGAEPGYVLAPVTSATTTAAAWKPVDLHGNELLAAPAAGQALHGPVKVPAAADGKRFGCLCGKRFAVKPKRDRHITLTLSLRPFGCAVCDKRFKLKHHLTEHMKTHGGARHACADCGRRFRARPCFLKHRQLCKGQGWAAACWTYK
ncbi:zinc finger and BTB domain-containing protein 9 [Apteryx mantelli]|uniref:Zinc finger and BTB domain-containing protein 9 n=1 Tax=Apteryx mantelli TaxID=2696672 RepID=A0ABM4FY65_9AVES